MSLLKPYTKRQNTKFCRRHIAGLIPSLANSFQGLMSFIAIGFISLSLLSTVLWESSQWLGYNNVRILVKRTPGKHEWMQWPPRINRNNVENGMKYDRPKSIIADDTNKI